MAVEGAKTVGGAVAETAKVCLSLSKLDLVGPHLLMILSSLALVLLAQGWEPLEVPLAQGWEPFLDLEALMLLSRLLKLVQLLSRSVRKLLRFVLICNISFRSSFFLFV